VPSSFFFLLPFFCKQNDFWFFFFFVFTFWPVFSGHFELPKHLDFKREITELSKISQGRDASKL
jgi:hypothetical protein